MLSFARARVASTLLVCACLLVTGFAVAGPRPLVGPVDAAKAAKPETRRIEDPAQIVPQRPVDLSRPPPVVGVPVPAQVRRPAVSYRNETPNVVITSFEEPTARPVARPGSRGRGFGPLAAKLLASQSSAAATAQPEPKIWGPVSPSIDTINFLNNSANADGFLFIPADPHGAAGPDHVVTVANVSINFHTKAGVQTYDDSLKNFFSGLGASAPTTYTFDPKVLWDSQSNRWLVVTLEQTEVAAGDPVDSSYILVAVSDDADPNGTWFMTRITSIEGSGGTKAWLDYPGFAFDEEAVYITGNMFRFSTGTFAGTRLYIIAKSGFYAGGAAVVSGPLNPYAGGGVATTSQPSRIMGTPPSGAIGTWLTVFSGLASGANDFVQTVRVDNPLTAPTFVLTQLNLGDFDSGGAQPDAPQAGVDASGVNRLVETNDRRALDSLWRSNALWMSFTHMPAAGPDLGQPTARYVKLATSVAGAVTFSQAGNAGGEDIGSGTHTFFPSLSVNAYDQMVMSFSAARSTIFPSIYAVSRRSADPAGTVSASRLIKAGVAHYYRAFGGSQNRWGDYTATAHDPSNECAWVYNKWADTKGTIIGSLPNEDGRWATTMARVCVCDGDETTPDTDFDGICENIDNCDLVANRPQTDTDGDGIGDACDSGGAVSTTLLATSPDPSVFGQSVTLTATVSGGSGTPTGTVTFLDGATTLGSSPLNGSGVATLPTSALTVGAHTITANYGGSGSYLASSDTDPHTVNKSNTATTITSDNPDASVSGQSVTVNYTVVATAPGAGTPTGNVVVTISGGAETCTGTVAAGTCALTLTTVGAGRTITASYAGDASFNASSDTEAHDVSKANSTTTITSDNPDASVSGESVTVSYTVVATAPGSGTPSGNVVVTISGGSETCTGTVAAGTCALTLTTAGAGRTITASYAGNASFNASSDTELHTVNKANTTTTITSDNPDASVVGQAVTVAYSITAVAPGSGTPTGNVVVTVSGGSETCTGTVLAGSCSLTLTGAGPRTITAAYAGDASFNASSDTEAHVVNKASTLTTITSDNPDASVTGEAVTVAFSVAAAVTDPDGGSETAAFDVVVTPVNDAPSFAIAGAQSHGPGTSGAQTVAGFVTSFVAGPFETQGVAQYLVTEVGDPLGIVSGIAVATNGTLTYTLNGTGGVATIRVAVRDDGGTANGGNDTSGPIDFTITVDPSADLVITKSNSRPVYVVTGDTYTWTIDASNQGPNAVTGALLSDTPPATLGSVAWTCTATAPAVCPSASGTGPISELVDLPVGGALRYALTATVVGAAGGTVANTAAIESPAGTPDLDPSDNSATDSDEIRAQLMFADGFE